MESNAPCLYKDKKTGKKCWNAVITGTGYCQQHQPNFAFRTTDRKMPKDWNRTVEFILKRDKGICYICGQEGADSVDHVIPFAEGGSDMPFNLKAIHDKVSPYCHKGKTAQDANRVKNKGNTPLRRKNNYPF